MARRNPDFIRLSDCLFDLRSCNICRIERDIQVPDGPIHAPLSVDQVHASRLTRLRGVRRTFLPHGLCSSAVSLVQIGCIVRISMACSAVLARPGVGYTPIRYRIGACPVRVAPRQSGAIRLIFGTNRLLSNADDKDSFYWKLSRRSNAEF
ncbi:hypothetical protein HYPSUDRAFT_850250 [Hypholoma sublateritium FD-334 SS-4]|uniref:Uncharacterized protein n=1 Tax=Hypholoma sublateritium (strain FD-334 SS-4) TaxID=945553 RepID=A0A0D2NTA7_HYPSF|nr:hypothetical protein HYPSUDRAFT_850250 [Hypholoma sublateritium FD-334 SS-4]